MFKTQWLIETVGGPHVGERGCSSIDEVVATIKDAFETALDVKITRAAEGTGLVSLLRGIREALPVELADCGEWTYRVPGIALSVTRLTPPE